MSKTHKTNLARRAWAKVKELLPIGIGDPKFVDAMKANEEANKTGRRYGNQRKMRAQMKVDKRRKERRSFKPEDEL